jgi:hypothetical protein
MSEMVTIAEAVTSTINDATLTEASELVRYGIEAEDSFADWDDLLEDLGVLHIDVVPASDETMLAARGNTAHQVAVDVAVRKRFDACDQDPDTGRIKREKIKELVDLLEEIAEIFTGKRMADYENGRWQATMITAPYSRRHLRENRQYHGVARLTFISHKQLPVL